MVTISNFDKEDDHDFEVHEQRVVGNLVSVYLNAYDIESFSKASFNKLQREILRQANNLDQLSPDILNVSKKLSHELIKAEQELLEVASFEQATLGGKLVTYTRNLLNRAKENILELEALRNARIVGRPARQRRLGRRIAVKNGRPPDPQFRLNFLHQDSTEEV